MTWFNLAYLPLGGAIGGVTEYFFGTDKTCPDYQDVIPITNIVLGGCAIFVAVMNQRRHLTAPLVSKRVWKVINNSSYIFSSFGVGSAIASLTETNRTNCDQSSIIYDYLTFALTVIGPTAAAIVHTCNEKPRTAETAVTTPRSIEIRTVADWK